MNCQAFQKQIILLAEISEAEKARVEAHIKTCASCRALFESVAYTNNLLTKSAGINPVVADPERLTNSIMRQLKKSEHHSWNVLDWSFLHLEVTYVRYALASITLFLTVLLGAEQFRISGTVNEASTLSMLNNSKTIVLDRGAFQKELRKSKATGTFSLANNCRSPFKINRINAACFKQRMNF